MKYNNSKDVLKNSIFNGILIIDRNGTILHCNQPFQKFFGFNNSELLGRNLDDIFNQDLLHKIDSVINMDEAEYDSNSQTFFGIKKDNTLVQCRIYISLIKGIVPPMIMLQIANLESLQRLEKTIFERNNLFLKMANNLPGVVYKLQVSPEEKFLYLSDGIKGITGYESTLFFGNEALLWSQLIHENDFKRLIESRQTQLTNLGKFDVNYRLLSQDGSIRWVKDQGKGIYDEHKNLVAIQGNILDITPMKSNQYENYANLLDFEDTLKSRISSSINDNLHQVLALSVMNLDEIENESQKLSKKSIKKYHIGMQFLDQAIKESRRISYDLIPKSIRDFGLVAAIEDLISLWTEKIGLDINFKHNFQDLRLPAFQENSLFIILREIFELLGRNRANADINIDLWQRSGHLLFSINSMIKTKPEKLESDEEISLKIIKKRAQAFQGEFTLRMKKNNYIKFRIQAPINQYSHETN